MLQGCRPLATALYRQLACAGTSRISSSAYLSAGADQVGPAEAAKEQGAQAADTDYNATPQYPNKNAEDAGEAAMAASRAPHPAGPMDTSSVNDPSGRAAGSYQQQQGQGSNQSSDTHSMHVHHPGRESDVAGMTGGGSSSDSFQASMTAGSGGASPARIDEPGSGPSGEGPGNMETGMEAANVVPGSQRAMTADFAAGGDDINPQEFKDAAPVNPDTGLPQMANPGDAGSGCERFGDLKNPKDVGEQGMTARQTEKSTGMDPGGHGSS